MMVTLLMVAVMVIFLHIFFHKALQCRWDAKKTIKDKCSCLAKGEKRVYVVSMVVVVIVKME